MSAALEEVVCTGIAASWCPIHGDCTCRDGDEDECLMCSGEYCAVHADRPCGCDAPDRHAGERCPLLAAEERVARERRDCPIHGDASDHPNGRWLGVSALDVLRIAQGVP